MFLLLSLPLLATLASASKPRMLFRVPGDTGPPTTNATFKQLIDHTNPALGTFDQFYYYSDEFYGGPGSPIILSTPGEVNATGYNTYLTTNRTTGRIAQQVGAAVIVLEHRYWGTSTPYTKLDAKTMRFHTLEQAIADFNYFAENVRPPFDKRGKSRASKAPWVFVGGSYPGALAGWIASTAPGTFWAYYGSSAVVQSIYNLWQYYIPVMEGMARNCSTDLDRVINHIDSVLVNGTRKASRQLKQSFGLGALAHDTDFANAIAIGPQMWQSHQLYTDGGWTRFCDYIEDANNTKPTEAGVGLDKALKGYAEWFTKVGLPGYCEGFKYFKGTNNTDCFDLHNSSNPMFTDTTLSNTVDRQWTWMLCNEPFGYWQTGAPLGRQTIVSRLASASYMQHQCQRYFPTVDGHTFGYASGKRARDINRYTGGWTSNNSTRVLFVNGQYDPWRESTVSAITRPGGPIPSTKEHPILVVPGGFHTSDLVTKNADVNPSVARVIDSAIKQIKDWVEEWPSFGDSL